jgi:hypothetical protein
LRPDTLEVKQKYAEAEDIYKQNLEVEGSYRSQPSSNTWDNQITVNVLEQQRKHDEAQPWKSKATEAVQKGYYDSI